MAVPYEFSIAPPASSSSCNTSNCVPPVCVLFTFGGHRKLAWCFTLVISWVSFAIAGALLSHVLLNADISYAIEIGRLLLGLNTVLTQLTLLCSL